jgi:flagellar biosynthetic protein FliQ
MEDFLREALWLSVWIALPMLAAVLVTALLMSMFQAATQILEPTLSFVPKLIVALIILALLGVWMGDRMVSFAQHAYSDWTEQIE